MRPLVLLLAAALALLIAAPAASAKTFKGTYKVDITSARYIDNNTGGDSLGDQLTFKIAVKQNKKKHAKRIAKGIGQCTRSDAKAWDCTSDIAWIGGHVKVGWIMIDGAKTMRLKVTGGTLIYAGASGEIKLTRLITGNPMFWRANVSIVVA